LAEDFPKRGSLSFFVSFSAEQQEKMQEKEKDRKKK